MLYYIFNNKSNLDAVRDDNVALERDSSSKYGLTYLLWKQYQYCSCCSQQKLNLDQYILQLRTNISRFSFSLVDVELVVEVVPIDKHIHLMSINEVYSKYFSLRLDIHVSMELKESNYLLITCSIIFLREKSNQDVGRITSLNFMRILS